MDLPTALNQDLPSIDLESSLLRPEVIVSNPKVDLVFTAAEHGGNWKAPQRPGHVVQQRVSRGGSSSASASGSPASTSRMANLDSPGEKPSSPPAWT